MQRKVPQAVTACFDLIERGMFVGPWVMGDAYTICDPYLFTLSQWWDADGVNSTGLPKLQDHGRRMRQRTAVVRALAAEIA